MVTHRWALNLNDGAETRSPLKKYSVRSIKLVSLNLFFFFSPSVIDRFSTKKIMLDF